MAATYEVEVTLSSAKDLKNVNWRNGPLKPYAVVWVDPKNKASSNADEKGDTNPVWNETIRIPVPPDTVLNETKLFIDIVHSGGEKDTKPLIGSEQIKLEDIIKDVGMNGIADRTLKLKRPSGRPHGKVEAKVMVKEHVPPPPSYPHAQAAYGVPYTGPPPYGVPGYGYGAPSYGQPPQQPAYGAPVYGAPLPQLPFYGGSSYGAPGQQFAYGQPPEQQKKKGVNMGAIGMGLAAGGVAGIAGGMLINNMEDNIADKAAENVKDDLFDD